MGTWDHGLLDNDCASDGVADLAHAVLEDIEALGECKPTLATTARLGAAVGVLLQLSSYCFTDERGATVVAAVQAHAEMIKNFPPPFRRVMTTVMAGGGEALAERPARMPRAQVALLHVGGEQAPFGRREPSLFAAKSAGAYVQVVARRCVEAIDEDFADEANWSDLCREGIGMGGLAALLVLAPCKVSARRLAGWRRKAQLGLATLIEEEDEELPFQREYYANLDRVFAALLRRFAA
jgi:hypothetical protein